MKRAFRMFAATWKMSRGIKRQVLTRFVFTIIAQIVGERKMALHPLEDEH
jgi:hypothetical protein